MSQAYDERVAKLAVASRIIEEVDLGLQNESRTLEDIIDPDFRKIITSSRNTPHFSAAILGAGFTFASAATAMGGSLGAIGLLGGGAGLLGLIGIPLLGPLAIFGVAASYLYKKKKEREKREQLEKDLYNAEKLALQKIIKKQNELIQALKRTIQESVRKQDEMERNTAKTKEYAKQKEERLEYLERLLNMVTMAGESFGAGAA